MNSKLVCVCVPCYNSAPTLTETLESILAQTYRELRIIVVDNASTDATAAIARGFAARDPRVRVERFEENVGYADNWNRCLALAEGDYIALYHADDIYEPTMVEREIAALEANSAAGAVFTDALFIDQHGKTLGRSKAPAEVVSSHDRILTYAEILRTYLKYGELFMAPSAMVRGPIYKEEIRAFTKSCGYAGDLEAWLRIAERHPVAFLTEPLMRYRRSRQSGGYNIYRGRTKLSDGFLALEPHVRAASAAGLLDETDRRNYDYLVLKDKVRCAVIDIIQGERSAARAMTQGSLSLDAFRLCAHGLGRLTVLGIAWCCWIVSFVPLPVFVRKSIFKIRFDYFRPYA
jgi:glycosyltransferase involved in cell wall biosynthesis